MSTTQHWSTMTADEFMEAHGYQVCTALRAMVDFWKGQTPSKDSTLSNLASEQVASWEMILGRAERVLD